MSEADSVQITKEGVAFLHVGDTVTALPDAEAVAEPVEDPSSVIHYHFPVHIEVHMHGHDQIESAIERRLEALASSLESL